MTRMLSMRQGGNPGPGGRQMHEASTFVNNAIQQQRKPKTRNRTEQWNILMNHRQRTLYLTFAFGKKALTILQGDEQP